MCSSQRGELKIRSQVLRVDFFTFIMFSFRSYWTRVMEYQAGQNLLRRIPSQKIAEIILACVILMVSGIERRRVCAKNSMGCCSFPDNPNSCLQLNYQLSYSSSLPKGLIQKFLNKVVNISKFVCIYTIIIIKRHAFLSSACISR